MCLILFAIDEHPEFDLVIAANRDEFYNRPTLQAHVWEKPAWMIGGKDIQGGGSWLGISPNRKLAMLTNFRDPSSIDPNAPSRGALITNYFTHDEGPENYLKKIAVNGSDYNGFNLLCENESGMFYYSNYGKHVQKVNPGVHGLSNALLDDPWPKVEKGKAGLHRWIHSAGDPSALFDLLYDSEQASDESLPSTGVSLDLERSLSSMFIKTPTYGSRTSTVILRDRKGNVRFMERTYNTKDFSFSGRHFGFRV